MLSGQQLTYPEVGATAAGQLPPGYAHLSVSDQIGTGRKRFEEAAHAVMHWGMQRGAGLAVWATSDTVAVSTVAVIQMMGVSRAPCRVVYVIDEPDIRGFAYGTLPGHPECGEERFAIRYDPDTSGVFVEVSSFSRPATWWSKAGGPFVALTQRIIAKRYLRGVWAASAEPATTRGHAHRANSSRAPEHICSITSPAGAPSGIIPTPWPASTGATRRSSAALAAASSARASASAASAVSLPFQRATKSLVNTRDGNR